MIFAIRLVVEVRNERVIVHVSVRQIPCEGLVLHAVAVVLLLLVPRVELLLLEDGVFRKVDKFVYFWIKLFVAFVLFHGPLQLLLRVLFLDHQFKVSHFVLHSLQESLRLVLLFFRHRDRLFVRVEVIHLTFPGKIFRGFLFEEGPRVF